MPIASSSSIWLNVDFTGVVSSVMPIARTSCPYSLYVRSTPSQWPWGQHPQSGREVNTLKVAVRSTPSQWPCSQHPHSGREVNTPTVAVRSTPPQWPWGQHPQSGRLVNTLTVAVWSTPSQWPWGQHPHSGREVNTPTVAARSTPSRKQCSYFTFLWFDLLSWTLSQSFLLWNWCIFYRDE